MARLINLRDTPSTGWVYTERATGQRFEHTTYQELVSHVRGHREYKKLPLDTIEDDIQDQLCLMLDRRWCATREGEDYRPVQDLTQKLTTDMALSANKAIVTFAKAGFQFNAPEEAAARAAICRTCPFNKPSSSCTCHAVYRLIESMIPAGRKQKGISVCMACGCSLQAKVNMPDEVVTASMSEAATFPEWCWQRPLVK